MTEQQAIAIAARYLDARKDEGGYRYTDKPQWRLTMCGQPTAHWVDSADMADLGQRLDRGDRDAYSLWCAETTALEVA